jgi:hypothetical protein
LLNVFSSFILANKIDLKALLRPTPHSPTNLHPLNQHLTKHTGLSSQYSQSLSDTHSSHYHPSTLKSSSQSQFHTHISGPNAFRYLSPHPSLNADQTQNSSLAQSQLTENSQTLQTQTQIDINSAVPQHRMEARTKISSLSRQLSIAKKKLEKACHHKLENGLFLKIIISLFEVNLFADGDFSKLVNETENLLKASKLQINELNQLESQNQSLTLKNQRTYCSSRNSLKAHEFFSENNANFVNRFPI